MPTPQFVLDLRASIGQQPLPLPSVTAVVLDDAGRVLLVRRADNDRWALVTGCLEPGEQPAAGALREVEEETGVLVATERIVSVAALPLASCANGDQVYWLDVTFRCRVVGGEARVNDDESVDVQWWELNDLPASLPDRHRRCLDDALSESLEARYELC
ncbi:MAG TPA: NUDIX domain-containing protein [Streptosporangiaceae bacterium]|nr:NUDIX domain-containing protein [Streptosporangiaceae bacterium]